MASPSARSSVWPDIGLFQAADPYNWTVGEQTLAVESTMATRDVRRVLAVFDGDGERRLATTRTDRKLDFARRRNSDRGRVAQGLQALTQAVRGDGGTRRGRQELESRIED
ncbi:hypothetical protein C9J85_14420 [Haloferax sp. wsp5]|nr:hypothetical protein C9J85_14420 [Haloferax sp. wsp5]